MMHFFGFKKMKVWIISSRNFETVVTARDAEEAVDVFYIYHPKERGDVWKLSKTERVQKGEKRGTLIGDKFHTYIFIKESPDELWVRSKPKVLYTHMDVKAPMGIARQGGEGVMVYMSKIQLEMLDHVIKEVMPSDTRSKMASRMITLLHHFLDGTLKRLPSSWAHMREAARRMDVREADIPRITKWDPPEQIEGAACNEAFNDPKDHRVKMEAWARSSDFDEIPLAVRVGRDGSDVNDLSTKTTYTPTVFEEIKPIIMEPLSMDIAEMEAKIKKRMIQPLRNAKWMLPCEEVRSLKLTRQTIPCNRCGGDHFDYGKNCNEINEGENLD